MSDLDWIESKLGFVTGEHLWEDAWLFNCNREVDPGEAGHIVELQLIELNGPNRDSRL